MLGRLAFGGDSPPDGYAGFMDRLGVDVVGTCCGKSNEAQRIRVA